MPFDNAKNEKEPYLKCNYVAGPLDEYLIGFTTTESRIGENPPFFRVQDGKPTVTPNGFRNHMFVEKDDVILLKDNNGLVKLFGFKEIGEGNCLISIRDPVERRISKREIPESEIVWR